MVVYSNAQISTKIGQGIKETGKHDPIKGINKIPKTDPENSDLWVAKELKIPVIEILNKLKETQIIKSGKQRIGILEYQRR